MSFIDDDELADAEFLASLAPKPVQVGPDPFLDPAAFIKSVNDYAEAWAEGLRKEKCLSSRRKMSAAYSTKEKEESMKQQHFLLNQVARIIKSRKSRKEARVE